MQPLLRELSGLACVSFGRREEKPMGLINWIFDFYQQYRIDQLQRDTAQARAEASLRTPSGTVDAE